MKYTIQRNNKVRKGLLALSSIIAICLQIVLFGGGAVGLSSCGKDPVVKPDTTQKDTLAQYQGSYTNHVKGLARGAQNAFGGANGPFGSTMWAVVDWQAYDYATIYFQQLTLPQDYLNDKIIEEFLGAKWEKPLAEYNYYYFIPTNQTAYPTPPTPDQKWFWILWDQFGPSSSPRPVLKLVLGTLNEDGSIEDFVDICGWE